VTEKIMTIQNGVRAIPLVIAADGRVLLYDANIDNMYVCGSVTYSI
jgi:hypothetical protein